MKSNLVEGCYDLVQNTTDTTVRCPNFAENKLLLNTPVDVDVKVVFDAPPIYLMIGSIFRLSVQQW